MFSIAVSRGGISDSIPNQRQALRMIEQAVFGDGCV